MSDFLTNLLARSFSSADVIRPRIPARFASPLAGAARVEPAVVTETITATTRQETPPPPPRAPAPARPAIGEELPPPPTARPVVIARAPAARLELPQSSDQPPAIHETPHAPPRSSGVPLVHSAMPDRSPTPAEWVNVAPASIIPRDAAIVDERRDIPPPEARPIEALLQLTEPPAPQPIQPNAIRVAPAPQVQPAAPPPITTGPPRISITIGRIEVRALPPNAPPPRPRPAQPGPPLSLDAYLKRRDGGGS